MSYETFAYYYDSLMDTQFYDDYHQFIKNHAKFKSVLELGCGTGEIAIRLAKDKKIVYATDISKDMLEVARMKAMDADVDLLLGRVDMTDFVVDAKVDLILCLCDSLNYVLQTNGVKNTFKNCYYALEKEGTFIFDVNSMHKMNETLRDYHEHEEDEEFYFDWTVSNEGDGKVRHEIEIIDKESNEHVKETHVQLTYPVDKYCSLLQKAGFTDIEIYSDFSKYTEDCQRVIFVCHKGVK